jgi:type I restriction enzyme, S subunit
MSFPRYPKYKASGVEWLGEVPEHWSTGRLRHFTRRYSGGTPDKTNLSYWQNGVIPWLNSGAVNDRLISEPSTLITAEAFANSSAKWIPVGALVMALAGQGKTKGMIAQLAIPSTCNQSMAAIVTSPTVDARFLFWWLDSNYQSIRNLAGGDLRDGLNLELVGNIPLPVVPLAEQNAIAAFLDRETAKIDGLVAEQKRLMELLKEKRQAVISHAVTKGIDPHAPMKPSGVEWLGDVPKHWEVVPIKWLSPVKRGASPRPIDDPKYFDEEGEYAWVRIADVSACDGVLSETTQRLSSLGSSLSVKILPNELFVSIAGTVGKPCISAIKACIHDGFVYFPTLKIEPWFLFRIFEAGDCYGGLGKWGTQLNLNTDTVGSIRVAVPPAAELIHLLKFLDVKLSRFDTLTAEALRAIDLLQERRTALISAAVSGQIDVRNQPSKGKP